MLQCINDHHMCAYLAEIAPDCSTEEEAAVACKLQCSTRTGEEEEDRHASDSSATNKHLAIRSGGITSRWAHAVPYRTHPSAKGVLFGPGMMHVHLQAKMRGCAVVNCGHSARQSSSPTFSCYNAKVSGRKACSRPAVLVRAEKKDQGLYGNIQQRLQGVSGCFA